MTEDEAMAIVQEMLERGWRDITSRYEVGTLDSTGKVFTSHLELDERSITARRRGGETIRIASVAEWEHYKQWEIRDERSCDLW